MYIPYVVVLYINYQKGHESCNISGSSAKSSDTPVLLWCSTTLRGNRCWIFDGYLQCFAPGCFNHHPCLSTRYSLNCYRHHLLGNTHHHGQVLFYFRGNLFCRLLIYYRICVPNCLHTVFDCLFCVAYHLCHRAIYCSMLTPTTKGVAFNMFSIWLYV